jgi:hypothetical protein
VSFNFISYNGWVYEKVFYLEISKFILTFVKNFLIHLVISSFQFVLPIKKYNYVKSSRIFEKEENTRIGIT